MWRESKRSYCFICIIGLVLFFMNIWGANAQSPKRSILWQGIFNEQLKDVKKSFLYFEKATYLGENQYLPYYYELIPLGDMTIQPGVEMEEYNYELLTGDEVNALHLDKELASELEVETNIAYINKQPYLEYYFLPFLKTNDGLAKITNFSFKIIPGTKSIVINSKVYKENSILNSGDWYKIKVNNHGMYRLSYDELRSFGLNNPENARLFGNGKGLLPENSSIKRNDDLEEIPVLHQNNAIIFYAEGAYTWSYDDSLLKHGLHLYSDYAYYFLTDDIVEGKAISTFDPIESSSDQTVTTYNDIWFYEPEFVNLRKSGKSWFGLPLSYSTTDNVNVQMSNLDLNEPLDIGVNLVGRAYSAIDFYVSINNVRVDTITINGLGNSLYNTGGTYALRGDSELLYYPDNDFVTIEITFNSKGQGTAEGWIDNIVVNAKRELVMEGGYLRFRDLESVSEGSISEFVISDATNNTIVWDVTDINNISRVNTTLDNTDMMFKATSDSVREYIAFNSDYNFTKPISSGEDVGKIDNQNLHGMQPVDFIIVTPPEFKVYSDSLAALHRSEDGLDVAVVLLDQLYNEFSSGTPDITAIRDFMKMHYDKYDNKLKYLLFFGDGTYDNKTKNPGNPNFIPTYQSSSTLNQSSTYVSDDYYGLLDDGEDIGNGKLDIGIGRFPVKDEDEAEIMLYKVKQYYNKSYMGEWRNTISLIGDDEDGNTYMIQAESIASRLNRYYPFFNTEKIYLDAYKQVSGTTGDAYPDVTKAITTRLRKGALIVNYIGHGGEEGLAHEKILTKRDILNWDNSTIFPVFFTATCEFSRFDDVDISSDREQFTPITTAGELVILNPFGGSIASYTTNRIVIGSRNYELNKNFFEIAFEKDENNQNYRMGDLIRLSKRPTTGINKRKFCLLGDPALPILCPRYKVVADSINGISILQFSDTVPALSLVSVAGHIESQEGEVLNDYNGVLVSTVFDKAIDRETLGNDGGAIMSFKQQDNILFKGRASINNGYFSFSFILPKDINYVTGQGKISFYAMNELEDGTGYYDNLPIGGFTQDTITDSEGPKIELYMNDSSFVFGGITDENPNLFAIIEDINGINTANSGIGHSITAIIDGDQRFPIVLNDFYQSELDNYRKGTITYPFSNLSEGKHTLTLKVWDIINNSAQAYLEFYVASSEDLILRNLINYPNPFRDYTSFRFEHNQAEREIDVSIQIFSLSGQLVKSINYIAVPGGYTEDHVVWDGTDDNGSKLGDGVYIYRIILESATGDIVNKSEKLVIIR